MHMNTLIQMTWYHS